MKPTKSHDLLVARLQEIRKIPTKKEAEQLLRDVTDSITSLLEEHATADGFTLKVSGFGKFTLRQRPGSLRRIPFTGEVKQTQPKRKIKFSTFGKLRKLEKSA